jgi:pyruvate formate lyase activating enzyme
MAQGVRNIYVSNGYLNPTPLGELCDVIDAANIDLKGFRDDIYLELDGGHLQPVLDTLIILKRKGVWFEVTHLVVPSWTDDIEVFKELVEWMKANIGVDYPLHISRFHPQYKLNRLPPTPIEYLKKAYDTAKDLGLNHVYVGNAPQLGLSDTFCPGCAKKVIGRRGYVITEYNLEDGACRFCGEKITGVWS